MLMMVALKKSMADTEVGSSDEKGPLVCILEGRAPSRPRVADFFSAT